MKTFVGSLMEIHFGKTIELSNKIGYYIYRLKGAPVPTKEDITLN
jgi:hypothetical protein